jgi:hypothetical protein
VTTDNKKPDAFEQRTCAVLEESVSRTDAHIRSRLTRARHAALEEALTPRKKARWLSLGIMPATGAIAAALLLAMVLWGRGPERAMPGDGTQSTFEVLELLADDEALNLMEEGDGAFYEWAVSQNEMNEGASI